MHPQPFNFNGPDSQLDIVSIFICYDFHSTFYAVPIEVVLLTTIKLQIESTQPALHA